MKIVQKAWPNVRDSLLRSKTFYLLHKKPINRVAFLVAAETSVFTRGWTPYAEFPLGLGAALGVGGWSVFASERKPDYFKANVAGVALAALVSFVGTLMNDVIFYSGSVNSDEVPEAVMSKLQTFCREDGRKDTLYDSNHKPYKVLVQVRNDTSVSDLSDVTHYAKIRVSFPYRHYVSGTPDTEVINYQTGHENGLYKRGDSFSNCSSVNLEQLNF